MIKNDSHQTGWNYGLYKCIAYVYVPIAFQWYYTLHLCVTNERTDEYAKIMIDITAVYSIPLYVAYPFLITLYVCNIIHIFYLRAPGPVAIWIKPNRV